MQLQPDLKFNTIVASTSCIYIQLSYIGVYAGNIVMTELGINL